MELKPITIERLAELAETNNINTSATYIITINTLEESINRIVKANHRFSLLQEGKEALLLYISLLKKQPSIEIGGTKTEVLTESTSTILKKHYYCVMEKSGIIEQANAISGILNTIEYAEDNGLVDSSWYEVSSKLLNKFNERLAQSADNKMKNYVARGYNDLFAHSEIIDWDNEKSIRRVLPYIAKEQKGTEAQFLGSLLAYCYAESARLDQALKTDIKYLPSKWVAFLWDILVEIGAREESFESTQTKFNKLKRFCVIPSNETDTIRNYIELSNYIQNSAYHFIPLNIGTIKELEAYMKKIKASK